MTNPKTTVAGVLVLAASVLTVAVSFLKTGTITTEAMGPVLAALTGLGLIGARDGGA